MYIFTSNLFLTVSFQIEPVEESFDLLNLNSLNIASSDVPKQSPSSNFDLLSGLGGNSNTIFNDPVLSSTSNINANGQSTQRNASDDILFDPFGGSDNQNNLLGGWESSSSTEKAQKPNDFFAEFGECYILIMLILVFTSTVLFWQISCAPMVYYVIILQGL